MEWLQAYLVRFILHGDDNDNNSAQEHAVPDNVLQQNEFVVKLKRRGE